MLAALGQQPVERAVDQVAVGRDLQPGADACVGLEVPAPRRARRPAASQRLLLGRRPVGRMHDAPRAARQARLRRGDHRGHPGGARRRLAPASQQFARQPLPGPLQQGGGALLLRASGAAWPAAPSRRQCVRGAAHAVRRRPRACACAPRHGPAPAARRRGARASPRIAAHLARAVGLDQVEQGLGLRFEFHRRLRGSCARHASNPSCERSRAARSGSGTSPCRSGTISTSGASADSAARSTASPMCDGHARRQQHQRRRARAPRPAPPPLRRRRCAHERTGQPVAGRADGVAEIDRGRHHVKPVEHQDRHDQAVDRDAFGQADEDQQPAEELGSSRPVRRPPPCPPWPRQTRHPATTARWPARRR